MDRTSKKVGSTLAAALASTLVIASTSAMAEEPGPGFSINPQVGLVRFDGERNLDDAVFPGLGLGYRFDNPWAVEFNYLSSDADVDVASGPEVDFEQIRLDALYHFGGNEKWKPYAAFGIGEWEFDGGGGSADETLINVGGGVKYMFTKSLSLRTDLRLFNSMDEEDQDIALTVGLNYQFGTARRAAPTPVATAPVAAAAPADSDGDGVIDSADRCPNTPANVAVDSTGCPLDSDNDGVADINDACPNTDAGARVDETGCYIVLAETKEIELQINFANNSAEVPEQYVSQIREVADFMREYPLTDVVVEGHTDDRGQESYNQQLSERRAQAVATVLVNRLNISSSRVSSVGKGEVEPVADNGTAEGRASNRRVVGVISATVERRAQ